jgi:hypothetical protein
LADYAAEKASSWPYRIDFYSESQHRVQRKSAEHAKAAGPAAAFGRLPILKSQNPIAL